MAANLQSLKFEYAMYVQSLEEEHYLDDQFRRLILLVDDSIPDFLVETVDQCFDDSVKTFNEINRAMHHNPPDYDAIDESVHKLKGSMSTIGVERVSHVCADLRTYCYQRNYLGCSMIMPRLMQEVASARQKLHSLFEMERNFLAAGGTLENLHWGVFT